MSVSIRASLTSGSIAQRLQVKLKVSEETGVSVGRISDHVFFNIATDVLFDLMSEDESEVVAKFKEALEAKESGN